MAQETQTGTLSQPRGVGWGGRWEGGSKERGYMYTYDWFIVEVWQKTIKLCKAIILQLKNKKSTGVGCHFLLQPSPGVFSNSCPLSWWCNLTISSSVVPFSSCLQSLPASGSFPMRQFFPSGSQSIGSEGQSPSVWASLHVVYHLIYSE